MALKDTGPDLGDKIAALITSATAPPEQVQRIKSQWEAIGSVIVNHFIDNLEIKAGIPVSTTGSPSAQTGSTTGTGKTA
jgi:hypothetical protein